MRSKTFVFAPKTTDATRFVSNATGATWTLTNTTTGDSLAHRVTIHNDAATDHSAKTALLTGTDADGKDQTETMNLPAGTATTTSTKYFLTLTSIVPSASIGADTMDVGMDVVSFSQAYPLDFYRSIGGVSLFCIISGTVSYGLQHTLEDVFAGPNNQSLNWLDHSTIVTKAASADGNYAFPVKAVRFKTNTVTNGATVTVTIAQGNR